MSASSNDDVREAYALIGKWDADDSGTYLDLARAIAAALAAEREKARAPFLALADELDADAKRADDAEPVKMDDLLRMITAARVSRSAADRIRRAVEDGK